MKKERRFLLLFLLLLITSLPFATAQNEKQEKQAQLKEDIKKKIESKNYEIEVNTTIPMRGKSIISTSIYTLKIKNDSVFSHLPYFGRAYRVPYDGGNGLNFEAPVKDYKVSTNKKGNIEIKFSARTIEDLFTYRIQIFDNGETYIDVTMQNREGISYHGQMDLENREE